MNNVALNLEEERSKLRQDLSLNEEIRHLLLQDIQELKEIKNSHFQRNTGISSDMLEVVSLKKSLINKHEISIISENFELKLSI